MNRKGVIGIVAALLLVIAIVPATAVKFTAVNVSITKDGVTLERSQPGQLPPRCAQNDTLVNMTIKFSINTTFPKTYIIGFYAQQYPGSSIDFSNVTANDLYVTRNSVDITNNVSILAAGFGILELVVNEGPGEFTTQQDFVINILNDKVKTPTLPENYTFAMGLYDTTKNVQYGESAVTLCIGEYVPPPIPPTPWVEPCGCSYKYDGDTLMQAVPEACFKLFAPYKEGFRFEGFKKFIDNPLQPVEVLLFGDGGVHEMPSDECLSYDSRELPAVNVYYDFGIGSHGWLGEGDWEWGEPIDLVNVCPAAVETNAFGLKLEENYTAGEVVYNLTSPQLGNCTFNGTVYVTFTYSAYLEDGDYVYVEGWDGTEWVEITSFTNVKECMQTTPTLTFTMNTSGEWSYTQIRFRYVSDNDEYTDIGFYVFKISIWSDDTCSEEYCAEYKPLYYYTDCQCLEKYEEGYIPLNSVYNVWTEALYYDEDNSKYVKVESDNFTIIIDNTPPEIEMSDAGDSYVFTVEDTYSGVDANADDEPIKVVAGEERYRFDHWKIDQASIFGYPTTYHYDVYDPSGETKSATIFFDRIELGYGDFLSVIAGCDDCEVFGYSYESEGGACKVYKYWPWGSYVTEACLHSAAVRVPLDKCETSCTNDGACDNCGLTCDNCAQIVFSDYPESREYAISVSMIVYGTGITVLKNGEDITSQCTISSDGLNATVSVPKSLLSDGDEIVVVATDNVGNANYYKYVAGESVTPTPTPTPGEEFWQNYDNNPPNGEISFDELMVAVNDWLEGSIDLTQLLEVVEKWLEG